MKRLCFHVELLSDTVVTRSSGTAGGHETLSYLPGGMFVGALARSLYREGGDLTWHIFHSGAVRFLPAYPLGRDGLPAMPTPLSFMRKKDADEAWIWGRRDPETDKVIDPSPLVGVDEIVNKAAAAAPRLKQPTRIGPEYLDAYGERVDVDRAITPKTAMLDGAAYDAHLFPYQSIRAGACFGLCVEIDNDGDSSGDNVASVDGDAGNPLAQEAEDAIRRALVTRPIRLGRSRTAEFGLAECREAPAPWPRPAPGPGPGEGGAVVLYCASDLLLLHPRTGQPTLAPTPGHFDLPAGCAFNAERSFLATRRYSPFNGHRRRPDPERHVIAQGSVIVFDLPGGQALSSADVARIDGRLARGIGAHREAGLGQVWLQPAFLADVTPRFGRRVGGAGADDGLDVPGTGTTEADNGRPSPGASAAQRTAPADALATWLEQQHDQQSTLRAAAELARKWSGEIMDHIPRSGGVTRSQWAMIRIEALRADSLDAFLERLFGPFKEEPEAEVVAVDGAAGVKSEARRSGGLLDKGVRGNKWRRSFKGKSPRDCLLGLIETKPAGVGPTASSPERPSDATVLRAVQILALRMPRAMAAENKGERS